VLSGASTLALKFCPQNFRKFEEYAVALHRKLAIPLSFNVIEVWDISAFLLALVWFHPILLQLRPMRAVAWIAAITVTPAIFALCNPRTLPSSLEFILFLSVSLTSLVLIGQRTRPWMSIIAGTACVNSLGAIVISRALFNGVRTPLLAITFANVVVGAVLLYGTRRIEH
jgi:hypothetical protein